MYQCCISDFAFDVSSGDILGPSIDGLENLLRMPTGCGEQNMIKLAPDLYIANYLMDSGQMTPSMHARVKHLIETGECGCRLSLQVCPTLLSLIRPYVVDWAQSTN